MQDASAPQTKPMMTIQESVKQCLRKYADFGGRAARAEFWWWVLATTIVSMAFSAVDTFIGAFSGGYYFSLLGTIFSLAILLPSLAVTSRRLHDIGKTGWWQLAWYIIAVIGWIALAVGFIIVVIGLAVGGYFEVDSAEQFFNNLPYESWIPLLIGLLITLAINLAVLVWAIVWMARQGQTGPNRFGPDPRAWDETEPATDAIE